MKNKKVISIDGTPFEQTTADQNGGFIALGYCGNHYKVYSPIQQQEVSLSPTQFTENMLKTVCGVDWCEFYYTDPLPEKGQNPFDYKGLTAIIMKACQDKGLYKQSRERRLGVWPAADGKGLRINGRELWQEQGKCLHRGLIDGDIYPAGGDIGFGPDTPLASQKEVNRILLAFNSLEYRQDLVPEMMLGWFACSVTAAALKRRPHIYLTGEAGIGKTTILNLMRNLLGPLAYTATGPQSMASFYQSLNNTTRAVILDEFEADSASRSNRDTLEIARQSYSLSVEDGGIQRGSVSGGPKSYRFFSPFFAAGVLPARLDEADRSRWVVVEATGQRKDLASSNLTEEEARNLGARLAATVIRRWSLVQESLQTLREAVMISGGDGRIADTVGPLLAGYWTLVSDKPASLDDALTLVGLANIEQRIEQREEKDKFRCLEVLLTKVYSLPVVEGNYLAQVSLSLAEAFQKICANPTNCLELQNRLAQLGLRVSYKDDAWKVFIANSPDHQELRKIFRGTKWQNGGWSMTLRRLAGGEESTQRLSGSSRPVKVTVFDMPRHLLPSTASDNPLAA